MSLSVDKKTLDLREKTKLYGRILHGEIKHLSNRILFQIMLRG